MALPTVSGTELSFSRIASEFNQPISNIYFSQYYRGGSIVDNVGANVNIPTSGQIAVSNFFGGAEIPSDTIVGTWSSTRETYDRYNRNNDGTLRINLTTSYLSRVDGKYSITISGTGLSTVNIISADLSIKSYVYDKLNGSSTGNRFENSSFVNYTVTIKDNYSGKSKRFVTQVGYNNKGNLSGTF